MFTDNLPLILIAWMAVVALMAIARRRKRTAGVGLVVGYVLSMWLLHWVASVLYVLPWYRGPNEAFTILGTEQSLYGICAFAVGSLVLAPVLADTVLSRRFDKDYEPDERLPRAYLMFGAVFYILLTTALGSTPTLSAIISAGENLTVVGLALCWWQAWRYGNFPRMALWLGMSLLPPILTVARADFWATARPPLSAY